MPTYDYQCEKCNHKFEHFQSITSDPLNTCPECGGQVKRLIGLGAGIIFKGSGFYCTDYKKTSTSAGNNTKSEPKPTACESCPAADSAKGCAKS